MLEMPVYAPTPLNSLKDIGRFFGVGKECVKEWIRMGAPIGYHKHGKTGYYFAEAAKLQFWRESTFPARDLNDEDTEEV